MSGALRACVSKGCCGVHRAAVSGASAATAKRFSSEKPASAAGGELNIKYQKPASPLGAPEPPKIVNEVTGDSFPLEELKADSHLKDALRDTPNAAARGAGIEAGRGTYVRADKTLLENADYNEGVTKMVWGYWEDAMHCFDRVSNKDASLANNSTLLLATGRCYLEQQHYEQASKVLKRCSVVDAGRLGLQEMLAEAAWGEKLTKEKAEVATAREKEIKERRARMGVYDKSDLKTDHDENLDTVNNLPLEKESRDWLAAYAGDALDKIGILQEHLKGRAVAAKHFIPSGTVLFQEKSLVFAPELLSTKFDNKVHDKKKGLLDAVAGESAPRAMYCSHCRDPLAKEVSQCSDCGLQYCSQECQRGAVSTYHAHECHMLRADATKVLRDRLCTSGHEDMWKRFLLIVRAASVGLAADTEKAMNDHPFFSFMAYREGEHKRSHVEKVNETPAKPLAAGEKDVDLKPTMYGIMSTIFLHLYLSQKHGASWKTKFPPGTAEFNKLLDDSAKDYDEMFDKVKMNAHKPQYVVPLFLCLLNHSCTPNAEVDSNMRLVATQDIQPGNEITVSYSPNNIPIEMKAFWLRQKHGFVCRCPYCQFQQMDESMMEKAVMLDVGDGFQKQNVVRSEQYDDPERLVTDEGRISRRGRVELEEHHDSLLSKYPKEFREEILKVQEKVTEDLETKSVASVRSDLKRRKERLSRFEHLGFVPKRDAEHIALDASLQSFEHALPEH